MWGNFIKRVVEWGFVREGDLKLAGTHKGRIPETGRVRFLRGNFLSFIIVLSQNKFSQFLLETGL